MKTNDNTFWGYFWNASLGCKLGMIGYGIFVGAVYFTICICAANVVFACV